MKKLLFILLFTCCSIFIVCSQSHLTIGQVYNFNVGDVFEEECGTSPSQGPPGYTLTIVLAKWYSAHSDTVFYKDSLTFYTPPSCPPPCTGTFNARVDTVYYTNLNSWAIQDSNPNECPSVWDSMYVDSSLHCWQKIWEQGPSKDCLDTLPITFDGWNTTYSWLIEGCGGPYTNIFFEGSDYNDYCSLVYAKKHDTVCGTEYVISSINSMKQLAASVDIYPNPSKGKFTFSIKNYQSGIKNIIEVFNVLGEKVDSHQPIGESTFTINLNQPNGIYFYKIITETGAFIGNGKIIIQK